MTVGTAGRIAKAFICSKLTPLLVVASLVLGIMAVARTPREEEPQIVVPMIDIAVGWPGAPSADVERLVTVPIERALREIPEVEYVYATSRPSGALIIARFLVNSDPERALTNIGTKLESARAELPEGVMEPEVRPWSIDDVPIVAVTFSSETVDPLTLRRVASEIEEEVRGLPGVARTTVTGGLRREILVRPDPVRLAARGLSPMTVAMALSRAGVALPAGSFGARSGETVLDTGDLLRSAAEVADVIVAAPGGNPVRVRDVAEVLDGPGEPDAYVLHAERGRPTVPAVTLSVAKIRGSNATDVAEEVLGRIEQVRGRILPGEIETTVTRDYGRTASEKSNGLIEHLLVASISVILLIAVILGWREGLVVGVAVPVTLALTLLIYYLMGYTLNRVTLFALIFAIGILVDDAIVVVENIHRHIRMRIHSTLEASVKAVDEVGNPTILATFTIIAAILPLAVVSGLMGPYMRPIPVGASFAMLVSLLVAFIVSPWFAHRLLKHDAGEGEPRGEEEHGAGTRLYRRLMTPLLERPVWRWSLLAVVTVLLLVSAALVPLKVVTVKMLPFDNKSELQIIVDAPEGTTLEATLAAATEMAERLMGEPEVRDIQIYAGTSAPFNFNGLVRHYFLRSGANVADLQVNLLHADERDDSSHAIAARMRPLVREVARARGLRVKVAEIPPGPPVLSTLVAEVYGDDAGTRMDVAEQVLEIFDSTDGVVDTDWYVEAAQPKALVSVDRDRAALAGVDPAQVAHALRLAVSGISPGVIHAAREREPVPVVLRLPRKERTDLDALSSIRLSGAGGRTVPLSEVTTTQRTVEDPFRYRKNGRPVTYVIGDVAGSEESPVYALMKMSERIQAIALPAGTTVEERYVDDETSPVKDAVVWDGEWRITYEVFRDLGLAFGAVLILIYFLVVAWFRSFLTPFLIMLPIPLTLVGILPGHVLTGIFFTATSMIGLIALAGIIVRNSILLVDFIELSYRAGDTLKEAVLKAGAVRFRPIFLTGITVVVGDLVMLLDPIFQGLAVSLISGIFASTTLTLFVIPLLYYMAHRKRMNGGGAPAAAGDTLDECPPGVSPGA